MRSEEHSTGKVKSILIGSCRMFFRDVQGFEVVVLSFYFRPLQKLEAHSHTDFFHLAGQPPDRMNAADFDWKPREGSIQFDRNTGRPSLFDELCPTSVQGFRNTTSQLVERMTQGGAFVRWHTAQTAQLQADQAAATAQILVPDLSQVLE